MGIQTKFYITDILRWSPWCFGSKSEIQVDPKSISGIILNDAAGLDMKNYLEENSISNR
jgi:hypothetical protein